MRKNKKYSQLQYVSSATLIEEADRFQLVRRSVISVTSIIIILIIWSGFAHISEISQTVGQIQPYGKSYVIQHLEGGIVQDVLVKENDLVKKDQILIKMDPVSVQSQLATDQSQEVATLLNIIRLEAYLKNKKPEEVDWTSQIKQSKYSQVNTAEQVQDLITQAKALLKQQNARRDSELFTIHAQVEQEREKMHRIKDQIIIEEKQHGFLVKEMKMYEELIKRHYVSQKDYLLAQRNVNQSAGKLMELKSTYRETAQSLQEEQSRENAMRLTLDSAAAKELSQLKEKFLELTQNNKEVSDRSGRTEIKSPTNGYVHNITIKAGSVIAPRAEIMEIVPADQELMVESRIKPRDIGHVKEGDPVSVKVLTYDYARYGGIDGVVASISPSTYQDSRGELYYKATITLNKMHVGKDTNAIKPGMTVQANIITGQKTILAYLLKPIRNSLESSFGER